MPDEHGSVINTVKPASYPDLDTRLGLVLALIDDELINHRQVESDLVSPFRFLTYAATRNRESARYIGAMAIHLADQSPQSEDVTIELVTGIWLVARQAINSWKFHVRVANPSELDEIPFKRVLVNIAQTVLIRENVYGE